VLLLLLVILLLRLLLVELHACRVPGQQFVCHHVQHSLLEDILLAVALKALHNLWVQV
jgi:hypothetical protein